MKGLHTTNCRRHSLLDAVSTRSVRWRNSCLISALRTPEDITPSPKPHLQDWAACLRKTGNLMPAANSRRQGHGRLVPYEDFFAELVEQDPDITLKELQAALVEAHGVQASLSGIDVVLRRLDLTYKKRASSQKSGANPM